MRRHTRTHVTPVVSLVRLVVLMRHDVARCRMPRHGRALPPRSTTLGDPLREWGRSHLGRMGAVVGTVALAVRWLGRRRLSTGLYLQYTTHHMVPSVDADAAAETSLLDTVRVPPATRHQPSNATQPWGTLRHWPLAGVHSAVLGLLDALCVHRGVRWSWTAAGQSHRALEPTTASMSLLRSHVRTCGGMVVAVRGAATRVRRRAGGRRIRSERGGECGSYSRGRSPTD